MMRVIELKIRPLKEKDIQKCFVKWLDLQPKNHLKFFLRTTCYIDTNLPAWKRAEATKLGYHAGISDLVFIWVTKWYIVNVAFLELKTETGSQSKAQKTFQKMCKRFFRYKVVRSVKECKEMMYKWGIVEDGRILK